MTEPTQSPAPDPDFDDDPGLEPDPLHDPDLEDLDPDVVAAPDDPLPEG